jgi:hypothetical protein
VLRRKLLASRASSLSFFTDATIAFSGAVPFHEASGSARA